MVDTNKASETGLEVLGDDFNQILRKGRIVDNKRVKSLNMKEVLKIIAKDSESLKCAVGYFYIEGLVEIINSLRDLKEVKILMGYDTTKPTKKELIQAFKQKFDELEVNEQTKPAIKLFYQLVQEYKTLKVRVYFGEEKHPERLHSKAYLFLRNMSASSILDRYKAGVIGSSNLTPSGLVGNTELNTIITEPRDLENIEAWFENLWSKGTEDFEKLKVCDALVEAINGSKFKDELENTFVYIEPKEFFKILIKVLNADYLFEEFKKSGLFQFQYIDFIRVLNNLMSKGYSGCFVTSSVGLGKSYVAAQIAKYFLSNGKKVILIVPAGLVHDEDQWPRYLKEFGIYDKVLLVSMGDLQKRPELFKFQKYTKNYSLIIIDEAHNYRNPDAYRTRNLRKIIDENRNPKVLFLTATPINTSLDDLSNLIKLFHRKNQNSLFDRLVRELDDLINLFKNRQYEELKKSEKEHLSRVQEEIEREIFVKSTRGTIKTSADYVDELKTFSGVDINQIEDPFVQEVKYELDSRYKDIVNGIVDFISSLSAAHLRLLDPEKGIRLGGFFKWILYKRFESDISSYFLTLKRLSKKSSMILSAVEKQDTKYLNEEEYEDDVSINFELDFKEKLTDVIEKIKGGKGEEHIRILQDLKKDLDLIDREVKKLEPFLKEGSSILFKNDQKMNQLNSVISYTPNKKILIFTEYRDTLNAIREYLRDSIPSEAIRFIDSNTKNKQTLIKRFNNPQDGLRILITTDTLSEGFNISGADSVINFDIPYNPVRIIQRVGRATRLDNPKEIKVLNFRPDDSIDVELKLVRTLELRIKDIIRFIGVEYRIWFETEKELLSERRAMDNRIYLEALDVLQKIRDNIRGGNFKDLEVSLEYSKPVLIFLQKAIHKYSIKKEDLDHVRIPSSRNYTLLQGDKGLSLIGRDIDVYNEEQLSGKGITELKTRLNFEKLFTQEITAFEEFQTKKKKEELMMQYFNDDIDKRVNNILDYISSEKLIEVYPEVSHMKESLNQVRNKCGNTTGLVLKRINSDIKEPISKERVLQWTTQLVDSFRKGDAQQKLYTKKEGIFAIGFLEG